VKSEGIFNFHLAFFAVHVPLCRHFLMSDQRVYMHWQIAQLPQILDHKGGLVLAAAERAPAMEGNRNDNVNTFVNIITGVLIHPIDKCLSYMNSIAMLKGECKLLAGGSIKHRRSCGFEKRRVADTGTAKKPFANRNLKRLTKAST
jgi:hypothetical protein